MVPDGAASYNLEGVSFYRRRRGERRAQLATARIAKIKAAIAQLAEIDSPDFGLASTMSGESAAATATGERPSVAVTPAAVDSTLSFLMRFAVITLNIGSQ